MCTPGASGKKHNERVKESVPSMSVSHASQGVPHQSADVERLLAGLDPEQREVALALRGPVRVLAGAGTGKTRAITHRIAYGVACGLYVPSRVLAVTFTTRAAVSGGGPACWRSLPPPGGGGGGPPACGGGGRRGCRPALPPRPRPARLATSGRRSPAATPPSSSPQSPAWSPRPPAATGCRP